MNNVDNPSAATLTSVRLFAFERAALTATVSDRSCLVALAHNMAVTMQMVGGNLVHETTRSKESVSTVVIPLP